MKKLTSLQIMMLMSLALGSSQIYSTESLEMEMEDDNAAIMLEFQAAQDEQAKMEVLTDLIELEPKVAERIITDEADLEATFNSIRIFVHKKNAEIATLNNKIDSLNNEKLVNEAEKARLEADVARLAVELTDAKALLERTQAKQRAKHKHNHRHEQAINDILKKSEQGLQTASNNIASFFNQAGSFMTQTANQTGSYITQTANQAGKSINKAFKTSKKKSKKSNN